MPKEKRNAIMITEQRLGGYLVEKVDIVGVIPEAAACSTLDEALGVAGELLKEGGANNGRRE